MAVITEVLQLLIKLYSELAQTALAVKELQVVIDDSLDLVLLVLKGNQHLGVDELRLFIESLAVELWNDPFVRELSEVFHLSDGFGV
jgi:hypothetical protein